jgi:hypothetical protein
MPKINEPSAGHHQFDALCAGVEEFDTLPELGPAPIADHGDRDDAQPTKSALDEQILAGLVSPC